MDSNSVVYSIYNISIASRSGSKTGCNRPATQPDFHRSIPAGRLVHICFCSFRVFFVALPLLFLFFYEADESFPRKFYGHRYDLVTSVCNYLRKSNSLKRCANHRGLCGSSAAWCHLPATARDRRMRACVCAVVGGPSARKGDIELSDRVFVHDFRAIQFCFRPTNRSESRAPELNLLKGRLEFLRLI